LFGNYTIEAGNIDIEFTVFDIVKTLDIEERFDIGYGKVPDDLCELHGLLLRLLWDIHPIHAGLETTTGPYSATDSKHRDPSTLCGTRAHRDPGRERTADGTRAVSGPPTLRAYSSLPEALPATGTHPGLGR
jgi:hypothetical protein